jgi:hypothetical protein
MTECKCKGAIVAVALAVDAVRPNRARRALSHRTLNVQRVRHANISNFHMVSAGGITCIEYCQKIINKNVPVSSPL